MNFILTSINENIIWGVPMLACFIFAGIYFTVRLKFRQFRFVRMIKETLLCECAENKGGSLTPFQTLSASLAATLGTGNIVAVGAAIAVGGEGAVFWMWASALLGMATTYAENFLGIRYRRNGEGGAFMYIRKALGGKAAAAYALFCILASFGMGNMAQMNAMTSAVNSVIGCGSFIPSAAGTLIVGVMLFGGMKRFGRVSEAVIPLASAVYILVCLWVIGVNITALPECFGKIFSGAFSLKSVGGGMLGSAMLNAVQWGLRRGVFSNEAGLGSSVIINSASTETSPQKQGSWAMLQVFIDTIVICTMTALVIIITGNADVGEGAAMSAFSGVLGSTAAIFLAAAIVVFSVSTAVGWSVFGSACVKFLFGEKNVMPYLIIFAAVSFLGGIIHVELVYQLSDLFNGLMAIPNIAAILRLSGEVEE